MHRKEEERQAGEYHACLLVAIAGTSLTGMANDVGAVKKVESITFEEVQKRGLVKWWDGHDAYIDASLERSLQSLREACSRMVIPIQLPIGEEKGFKGVVDLVTRKAHLFQTDESGKFTTGDVVQTGPIVNNVRGLGS